MLIRFVRRAASPVGDYHMMAGGSMVMADPTYAPLGDDPADDLPRTFRREKEAREREARERAARERAAAPTLSTTPDPYAADPYAAVGPKVYVEPAPAAAAAVLDENYPAVVRRIDVPFGHLVVFFLKATVAAIPALILLTAILWGFGQFLQTFFPELVKMKILIGVGG
ncbi:MAG TPA: hypothetical protein PKD49_06655 [Hyphomicrobium sp.]|nr:hypothetical protein [Hyphomicrobium sp.]